jgi:hypothetical protein
MDTLVTIGMVLGLDPNAVAELYGYWMPEATSLDARISFLRQQLARLDEDAQMRVLDKLAEIAGREIAEREVTREAANPL